MGSRIRLFSGISPCTGPWGYRHWGRGRRGGGTCSPSPVSHAPDTLLLVADISARATHTPLPATPAPPTPSARDTHTLLPATPTPPAPSLAGYPYTSAGIPHLARAFGAPPPPPPRGRGPCVAISGEQPCPALLRDLPVHWTVWISPRGEGPTGRGNLFPLPCLSRSRHLAPCQPYPARPSAGRLPIHLCWRPPPHPRLRRDIRALLPAPPPRPCLQPAGYPYASAGTPTPPAPSALLPRPLLGAGSVRGDIR